MVSFACGCIKCSWKMFSSWCNMRFGSIWIAVVEISQVCCSFPTSVLSVIQILQKMKVIRKCLICMFLYWIYIFRQFMWDIIQHVPWTPHGGTPPLRTRLCYVYSRSHVGVNDRRQNHCCTMTAGILLCLYERFLHCAIPRPHIPL